MQVGKLLQGARRRLSAAGIETAGLDARLLMEEATGLSAADQISQAHKQVADSSQQAFGQMVNRRIGHEPIARIIGRKEFWGLSFELSGDTLVPRPETETLVEAVLSELGARQEHGSLCSRVTISDLGTGSGAILIALLSELKIAKGVGIDISGQSIATAKRNSEKFGYESRTQFMVGDYSSIKLEPADILVSNPPYIKSADIAGLATEVSRHDPINALDGGPDGLDAYRVISGRVSELCKPGGMVALEVGANQSDAVVAMLAEHGLTESKTAKDLSGHERVVITRNRLGR